ncbi:MAG: recombinase family protein [Candidatus Pacebacteria bacterium]|nr:recombinase family protein [Candidatus Paceibacterota bacterium]
MKYVIYCRKSTDTEDRQVQSLESQENELKRLAEAQGLHVVAILHESMSAKSEGRPVFNKVLEMFIKGKVDGIICWKLDRLARNFIDGGRIIDLLQKSVIKEIRTPESIYLPNDNVLMISMQFGMANQYSRDLSMNVKRGLRTKLEKGEWLNKAPLGYLNDKIAHKIIIDPVRSKYIIRAFELFTTGKYGHKDISNILFSEGFRSSGNLQVPKSAIQTILLNPFYCGLMKTGGKIYNGNHTPIISKAIYDKAQEVMQERLHPRKKTLLFPVRGLIKCSECGCMYTASRKKGHDYYYCTNGKGICTSDKKYLRENDLYKKLLPILEKVAWDKEEIELLYLASKEDIKYETGYLNKTLENLKQEAVVILERQGKLLNLYLDGSMSKELYEEKNIAIENQRVLLAKQISEIEDKTQKAVSALEPTKKLFLDCVVWAKEFLTLPPEKKQNIVHEILWNLNMKEKNIVDYQLKSPYSAIANLPQNANFHARLGD